MKVACVTTYDVMDIEAFAGRCYYMVQSLKNQFTSFESIGPLVQSEAFLFKVKRHFYKRLFNKRYAFEKDQILLRNCARQISRKLPSLNPDIIFSPMSPGSQPIAYLECDQPIVIWADSTFAGVIDFYPELSRSLICQETIRDGLANERAALNKCNLVIYPSDWAAQIAIDHYQIDPSKVKVVPFGANIPFDTNFDDVKTMIDSRVSDQCKLLFLGFDWHRKGGDIAFAVAKKLNEGGLKTELTVVGCHPDIDEPLPDFVKTLGYVNKSTKAELNRFNQLLAKSHFLILPTKADTFPYVLCEASCFGVPCLTTNVGGISTAVRNDLNGRTFSKDASIEEYCTYISDLFSNYSQYKELALSSFHEYQSRLNWVVAAQTVKKLMMELKPHAAAEMASV